MSTNVLIRIVLGKKKKVPALMAVERSWSLPETVPVSLILSLFLISSFRARPLGAEKRDEVHLHSMCTLGCFFLVVCFISVSKGFLAPWPAARCSQDCLTPRRRRRRPFVRVPKTFNHLLRLLRLARQKPGRQLLLHCT